MRPAMAGAAACALLLAACGQGDDSELTGDVADDDGLASHIIVLEEEMASLHDRLRQTQADLRAVEDALVDAEDARERAEEARAEAERALAGAPEGTGDEPDVIVPDTTPLDETPEPPASPGTTPGLSEQLHLWAAGVMGEQRAVTGTWQAQEVPDGYGRGDDPPYSTPGEVVFALAQERYGASLGDDWEVTSRVLLADEDAAVAVILAWGMADEAVVGHDIRVTLRRVDDRWHVRAIEERPHCRDDYDPDAQACR